ncbi:2-aminoethylphosphonate ABC transporter permease subunit [Sinomonas sp. ASV322]|uniref:2-aminoethylphosphonate ABC transporter permease subunit n=1 Tax=Sinomonas sp. ASV322 TaxID=3041920 RepID=UPI0027DD5574|nr:2-aminoethylphosphonate ABC transporter permease subunit [Sinomonas sp. ASV322]MDQ4502602.1 2-aminoethylphosphonate ABC transporter permease subunit [Sinomonas sp. ASV322]
MSAAPATTAAGEPTAVARAPRIDAAGDRKAPRALAWAIPPLAIVALIFLVPLAETVWQSVADTSGAFTGFEEWGLEFASAALPKAVGTTLWIAVLVTAGCVLIGTFLAVGLSFVPFRGSGVAVRLLEAVVSFPSFIIPLAFGILYGRAGVLNSALAGLPGAPHVDFVNDVPGVVLAEITYFTPFVVRPLLAVFGQLPRELLDVSGSLGAGPLMTIRRVVLPAARPALAASAGLVFLLAMNEFGIIMFTGAKNVVTLPMLIYTKSIVTFDLPAAGVVSCVQLALSLGVYGLYRALVRRLSGGLRAAA